MIWDKSYEFVTKKEKNVKFIDVNDVLIKYGKRIKKIRPKKLHEYFNNKNTKVIKLPDYIPTINQVPRIPDIEWIPPTELKIRAPWTIKLSVFKDYIKDDDNLMNRCFDFDFPLSKIDTF